MDIRLNGQIEKIDAGITLKTLLTQKQINPNTVACELNLKIIRRAELDNVVLHEGDTLEVIRMIGGG